MKRSSIIKQIICIALTLVSVILSYSFCEPLAFDSTLNMSEKLDNKLFVIIAVTFIFFMYAIWNLLISIIIKLKNKDKKTISFLKHFCIYFGIMLVFLIIMWPGRWVWDELYVIDSTQNYSVFMWQSVITQIYYAMALLICPHPFSIVIMQIILISLIMAYIQTRIQSIYQNKWFNIVIYVLFLLPAVIINNLYILRLPMYSYLTLLFLAILVFDYIQKQNITLKKAILLCILAVAMILWRSEGIIFLIFVPILLGLTYKNLRNILKIGIICVALISTYFIYSKTFAENEDKTYGLLIYVNPLSVMLQEDLNVDENDLEKINSVLVLDEIKSAPSYTETPSYWNGGIIRSDFEENLDGFSTAYLKVVLKNPFSFLKARFKTLLATSGMDGEFLPQVENRFLYNVVNKKQVIDFVDEFCNEHEYMEPLFKDLKISVESFLIGQNASTREQNQIVKVLFWNFIPVLIGIFIIGILSIIKRKWLFVVIAISLLAKSGVVFLTAPASYFMYYFPEYIVGFLLISIVIFEKIKEGVRNDRFVKEK